MYTLLILGLAASLRVSDALKVIEYICEVAVSPGEEVWLKLFLSCFSASFIVFASVALLHISWKPGKHGAMTKFEVSIYNLTCHV